MALLHQRQPICIEVDINDIFSSKYSGKAKETALAMLFRTQYNE